MKKIVFITLFLMCYSCVTPKKYRDMVMRNLSMEGVANEYLQEIYGLNNQLKKQEMDRIKMVQDTMRLFLQKEKAIKEIVQLRENNRRETGRVLRQLNDNQRESAVRIQRISNMESLVKGFEESIHSLKTEVDLLLMNYRDAGVSVFQYNGRVMVVLPQDILFAPGSVSLSTKGDEIVSKFSMLLRLTPNLNMSVVSYMDTTSKDKVVKEWTTQSNRLNIIAIKALSDQTLDPSRVSSRVQGAPPQNKTFNSLSKSNNNTDINIIFAPNLDVIYDVISSQGSEPRNK